MIRKGTSAVRKKKKTCFFPTKIQYYTVIEYKWVKMVKTKCNAKVSESHRSYGNFILSQVSSEYQ